jgi:crotonobetainyl-CoA:carnitine CoA-transferase CaiB-like acyl-CoA transferase
VQDLADSPQLAACGYWQEIHGAGGRMRLPGALAHTSIPAFVPPRAAPRLGEHNAEVFGEPGAGVAELAAPRARDAVRTAKAASTPASPQALRPLHDLKIVDLSWVVAGPSIGRVLADYGATVIRIETPRRVDTARLMGPFVNADRNVESSALYGNVNAGKRGLSLDLSFDEARDAVRDLARWGDVVIEAFAPGMMQRWGLDYEALRAVNPGMVMLSTSLAGGTGPHAAFAGYGGAGAAMSGMQYLAGYPDRPPKGPFGPYTDFIGPRFALVMLLAALEHRRRTGAGCYIDSAQAEAGIQFLAQALADYSVNGRIAERIGNRDPAMAPHGVYACATAADCDTTWVAIAVRDDQAWQRLARIIGGEALARDQRFATAAARLQHADALDEIVAAWTADSSAAQVESRLQAAGIAAHRASSSADMLADAQLAHRGHFITLPHPAFGRTVVEGSRFRLSETPARVERPAPRYGEHNREILRDLLGYNEQRIAALEASGALGSAE